MMSVQQAVRALRRELSAALIGDADLPPGAALVADRVVVSLGVCLTPNHSSPDAAGTFMVATDSAACLHHVEIQFQVGTRAVPLEGTHPVSGHPALSTVDASNATDASTIFAVLSEIFGPPGFDSSARASVFRETLEPLPEAQRRSVLGSLSGQAPSEAPDPSLYYARHLIRRLAASGPSGLEQGIKLLERLAQQGDLNDLIQIAATRWRTQSEWATEASAGEPSEPGNGPR